MEQNGQRGILVNLLLLAAAGGLSYGFGRSTPSASGQMLGILAGFGLLLAIISWFHLRLRTQEKLETLELQEITQGGAESLFSKTDTEAFPAKKSRESFEKFFLPVFTVLWALGLAAAMIWSWRQLNSPITTQTNQPMLAIGFYGGLFLILFLIGQYTSGLARLADRQLLRPSGNFLLFIGYLSALTAAALGAVLADFPRVDHYLARLLVVTMGILSTEALAAVILDLYRPRLKGKEAHPVYDSRLIGLVSHPESVFTTAATALDYQFGFKVSETWFYQFIQRSFLWIILGQIFLLALSTCFVFVNPGEQALLERFGKPVESRPVLGPGLHLKWPYPIDQELRFRTDEVQTLVVGGVPSDDSKGDVAFLWTRSHYKEEYNLLLPSESAPSDNSDVTGSRFPISFLTVSIPIHYQISDVRSYAYRFSDAGQILESIANREVVKYFSNIDIGELMSTSRSSAADAIRQNIQARADEAQLGVQLLFVGLQDIHPPVQVAASYEEVVSAEQNAVTARLKALAYEATNHYASIASSNQIVGKARVDSDRRVSTARAEANRYTNQIIAYKASPAVYKERLFLQAYTNGLAGSKKILVATTNSNQVIQLDLQQKVSDELARVVAPAEVPKKKE